MSTKSRRPHELNKHITNTILGKIKTYVMRIHVINIKCKIAINILVNSYISSKVTNFCVKLKSN